MKKLLLFLLIFSFQRTIAQIVLENNPPDLKWFQVNTPHFRIIFPEGFDEQAQRVASTMDHIRSAEATTLGSAPRKISIILQNQSSVSNGFVSMFPRRAEFFTMPTQNYNFGGTNDWLNLLASHEYRHIVQYQQATRGFNKLFYYLFGSPALAAMAHVSAPDWFWEGDAVVTETAFTEGGRGRIPQFNTLFRTNLLEGRTFNYHKQYLRSYKNNIPNHYVLGYHMVSYLRKRTNDPHIWEKITSRSWSVPFIPFAFSNAIRKETGMGVSRLYKEMAKDLKQEWQAQVDSLQLTPFEKMNKRRSSVYTDYMYPQPQEDGSVLALKHGIGNIEEFVLLKDGKENKIFTPGLVNDAGMLSSASSIVVWNEFGFDPRWQVRNYTQVKGYDWKNKVKFQLGEKESRYASAAISPDAKHIVTIESDVNYKHSIVVLSFPKGNVEHKFPNAENFFYSMPQWSNDGNRIIVVKTTDKGKTFSIIDGATGVQQDVVPITNENLGYPVLHANYLLFNSGITGIDNVYAIDLNTKKRYQITTSKYGAYNPAVSKDGQYVYYNEQSKNGIDVVRVKFDPASWKEFSPSTATDISYHHLIEQEGDPKLFSSIPTNNYPVKKYSRIKNLINPFSWGLYLQNDLTTIDAGVTSTDLLSTTSISAGYRYDLNEREGTWRAGISYQGFYPIIDVDFSSGERSVDEGTVVTNIIKGDIQERDTSNIVFKWKETSATVGLRIPLALTKSKYITSVTIGNAVGVTHVTNFRNAFLEDRFYPTVIRNDTIFLPVYTFLDYVGNGNLLFNHAELSAYRLLKQSKRDINSKWGQALFVDAYSTPFGGDYHGALVSGSAYLFFPGLFKHHSFNVYGGYQRTVIGKTFTDYRDDYLFRNTIGVPRGLTVGRFQDFVSTSVNYAMPLWYPDIAFGPLLNVQRVKLNLFSDNAFGKYGYFRGDDSSYHSVGGELTFDFNIMRYLSDFNLGVRYSYGIQPSVSKVEIVLGTISF